MTKEEALRKTRTAFTALESKLLDEINRLHNEIVALRTVEKRSSEIKGVKHDSGKTRPSLVLDSFANALDEVSKVATFGARKYTDDGWVNVPDGVRRYKDALYRHLMAEAKGEPADPESELLHLAHAAWNVLAVLELKLRKDPDQEHKQHL